MRNALLALLEFVENDIAGCVLEDLTLTYQERATHPLLPCGAYAIILHPVSLVKVLIAVISKPTHFRLPRQLHLRPLVYITNLHIFKVPGLPPSLPMLSNALYFLSYDRFLDALVLILSTLRTVPCLLSRIRLTPLSFDNPVTLSKVCARFPFGSCFRGAL